MASFNHRAYRVPALEIDQADRFGHTCSVAKCEDLPVVATRYDYVTGRRGRISWTERRVCADHGRRFAVKHSVVIQDVYPEQAPSPSAATLAEMTGENRTVETVRVHRTPAGQWYQERRWRGGGFSSATSWMAEVPRDASLDEALAAADAYLAQQHRQVRSGEWRRGDYSAVAEVIPAQRHDDWFGQWWILTIYRDSAGMWHLQRSLDRRLAPIDDDLGDHNMSLGRAISVADALLDQQGWRKTGPDWERDPDGEVAEVDAWHPDQVRPASWRKPEAGDA